MSAAIRPDAAEAAQCAELAVRARWLRQRAAAIKAGAPTALRSAAHAEALARGMEARVRMAADAALDEAARAARAAQLQHLARGVRP